MTRTAEILIDDMFRGEDPHPIRHRPTILNTVPPGAGYESKAFPKSLELPATPIIMTNFDILVK